MTEAEWLASDDPSKMIAGVASRTQRKTQLFAFACCRQISPLLTDKGSKALTRAELALDGQIQLTVLVELQPDLSARYGSNLDADSAVTWALRDW